MRSTTAIIKLRWHATAGGGGHVKSAAGLLDYVHHHDRHPDLEQTDGVEGLTRYVAWRDQATPDARLFDAARTVSDDERAVLAGYIERSVDGLDQTPGWRVTQNRKAFYHLIISPEDAHGLDLRDATRCVMSQLGDRCRPRWAAALDRRRAPQHPPPPRSRRAGGAARAGQRSVPPARHPRQRLDACTKRSRPTSATSARTAPSSAVPRSARSKRRASHRFGHGNRRRLPLAAPAGDRRELVESLAWSKGADRDLTLQREVSALPIAHVARIAGRLASYYQREAEREARRRLRDGRDQGRERGE